MPVADSAVALLTVAVPVRLAGGGSDVPWLDTALRLEANCWASWSSWDCAAGKVLIAQRDQRADLAAR